MNKTAFITGITGQDGAYLARFLLEKGYKVVAGNRRLSTANNWRLEELGILQDITMESFDLAEDATGTIRILEKHQIDEFYNLAAQSFVATSFSQPVHTSMVDYIGVLNILEAIRSVNKEIRFYQASSSEMYGKVVKIPQNEETPFYPRSPYAVAKLAAHWININYRESYNIHGSNGILFNHESPLRGEEFITRKVTSSLAKIKYGKLDCLELGNIDARRDWGYALDYVEGMWLMLQQSSPGDYVLATGETHSGREFCSKAAELCGFDLAWEGIGEKEVGIDKKTGKIIVRINPAFYRPTEVDLLIGDPTKALQQLGWKHKIAFDGLVELMMESDLKLKKQN